MNRQNTNTIYRMDLRRAAGLSQGWKHYRSDRIKGLISVLVVLLGVAGVLQYTRLQTAREARAASLIYDKMINAMQGNHPSEGLDYADTIMRDYKKTTYASLAAFMAAKEAVSKAQWDKALEHFQFVLSHTPKGSFADITRLRMASILTQQKNYTEALAILAQIKPESYLPLVEELKGDIYVLKQERDKAREAYAKAMQALPMGAPLTGRLQLKQIEVGFAQPSDKKESS